MCWLSRSCHGNTKLCCSCWWQLGGNNTDKRYALCWVVSSTPYLYCFLNLDFFQTSTKYWGETEFRGWEFVLKNHTNLSLNASSSLYVLFFEDSVSFSKIKVVPKFTAWHRKYSIHIKNHGLRSLNSNSTLPMTIFFTKLPSLKVYTRTQNDGIWSSDSQTSHFSHSHG